MSQQDLPQRGPILRHSNRLPGGNPDPVDGPFAIERLTVLTHELGNLLDGSMRCLSLARRALTGDNSDNEAVDGARKRIETALHALERMADLVHAAMKGSASVVGSPALAPNPPIRLDEAIGHAADVVGPEADDRGIDVNVHIDGRVAEVPAGPLYAVILNGLRNAIESIARLPASDRGGHIDLRASIKPVSPSDEPGLDLILIEITDDGRGFMGHGDPNQAFALGFTTKPGSLGVGLALSREVVREIGGMIELAHRDTRTPGRPGAALRIVYPVPRDQPRA